MYGAFSFVVDENSGEEIIYVVNTGYQSMDSVRLADGTKVMLNAAAAYLSKRVFWGEKGSTAFGTSLF